MQSYTILQSSASFPLVFLLVSSSDHISPVTGLGSGPTVTISKNGGAFASPAGGISEIGSGWYKVAGNGTDTNTLGPLLLHATGTGADPTDCLYPVVAYNPQSASNLGLSALPTVSPAASGGLPTCDASNGVKISVGVGAGQINAASGKVPATLSSTDVAGNLACDLQTIKTQSVVCAASVTVGAFIGNATAALAVDASGRVTVITNSDKTGYSLTVTPPTAAAVATAVWQDTTAGDFTTVGSIGKSLFTSGAVPGAAGGLFIAGTNAATTVNFTGNLSGSVGSVTGLTTATIATAVWSDTTAGDFTTTGSPGKILVAQLGGTFTTATSSIFSTASLANAPTGGSAPTTAQIATAVWQDATAGDFTTVGSIGKSLYTAGAIPGAANGLFIAGSNAATSVTTAFTTTFAGNLAGSVASVTGNVAGNVSGSVASVSAPVTLSTSQVLGAPRALDAIADGEITVNDALWSALGAGTGKQDASSGTSLLVKTPSTGTTLRTFTLTVSGGNAVARA